MSKKKLKAPMTITLETSIPRGADGVKCLCGGYAEETECTRDEIRGPVNCGRSWACCVAAFICVVCGSRIVAGREAPEME